MTLLLAVRFVFPDFCLRSYEVRGTRRYRGPAVIGATSCKQGTSNGSHYNLDGRFTLRVPSGETLLEVSLWDTRPWLLKQECSSGILYEDTDFWKS